MPQSGLPRHAAHFLEQEELDALMAKHGEDSQIALLQIEIPLSLHRSQIRLQNIADTITPLLREEDRLFRLDAASLGVLLVRLSGSDHAVLAARRIRQILDDNPQIHCHPRIGIALCPQHGVEVETLLASAQVASRLFIQDGVGLYDPLRDRMATLINRLEVPLRAALQQNRMYLVFQPQVDCSRPHVRGLEALLRWNDETLGPVPPDEIVEAAEQLGLIDQLSRWVIQTALRHFAELRRQGYTGTLSLNLSASNLRDETLAGFLANALAIWNVPADRLMLEITESAVIDDFVTALKQVAALRELGCQLALDDFGTGYSSLAYLKKLPLTELKIDRGFIHNLAGSHQDQAIVACTIELAHRLGLQVTAEGVETDAVAQLVREQGCDMIQGYIYSRPLLPQDISDFIRTLERA